MSGKWDFWIDRGGTFTDVIGRDPKAACIRASCCRKIPKPIATPPSRASATCSAWRRVRRFLPAASATSAWAPRSPPTRCSSARATAFFFLITKGFRDALRIAYQARPDIFAKEIILPEQLYERVVEVDERVRADGSVERLLDIAALEPALLQARADGIDAVAIVFMHAWKFPEHERAVAELCRRCGFSQVSVSHEVSPLVKLVGRGDTTVVDAYLTPILSRYVSQVAGELGILAPPSVGPPTCSPVKGGDHASIWLIATACREDERCPRSCQSPPLRGRWPAGQRGVSQNTPA